MRSGYYFRTHGRCSCIGLTLLPLHVDAIMINQAVPNQSLDLVKKASSQLHPGNPLSVSFMRYILMFRRFAVGITLAFCMVAFSVGSLQAQSPVPVESCTVTVCVWTLLTGEVCAVSTRETCPEAFEEACKNANREAGVIFPRPCYAKDESMMSVSSCGCSTENVCMTETICASKRAISASCGTLKRARLPLLRRRCGR